MRRRGDRARRPSWRPLEADTPRLARVVLAGVRPLRPLLGVAGVDVPRFEAYLRARLVLELRAGRGDVGLGLALTLTLVWLLGLVPAFAAGATDDPYRWGLLAVGVSMALVLLALAAQVGEALVDTRDLRVVAPLPLDDRTLLAGRAAHALVLVLLPALLPVTWSLALAPRHQPPLAVLVGYPLAVLLSTALCVAAAALLLGVLVRAFGPAAFRRALLAAQAGVVVVAYGGGHLVANLPPVERAFAEAVDGHWARHLFPPSHFAGLVALAGGEASRANVVDAALAVLAPLVVGWLALRPGRRLVAALSAAPEARGAERRGWRPSWVARAASAGLVGDARAGARWAVAAARGEPALLRQGVTQVAGFTFLALVAFRPGEGFRPSPFALYVLPAFLPGVLAAAQASERWEATRLLFPTLPIADPRRVQGGATRALLVAFGAPPALLVAAVVLAARGAEGAQDVALALVLAALAAVATVRRIPLAFPLSRELRHGETRSADLGLALLGAAAGGAAAAVHLALRQDPRLLLAGLVAALPVLALEARALARGPRRGIRLDA